MQDIPQDNDPPLKFWPSYMSQNIHVICILSLRIGCKKLAWKLLNQKWPQESFPTVCRLKKKKKTKKTFTRGRSGSDGLSQGSDPSPNLNPRFIKMSLYLNPKNFQIQSQSFQISIPIPKFEPNPTQSQEIPKIVRNSLSRLRSWNFEKSIPISISDWDWNLMGLGSQCRPLSQVT